MKVSGANVLEGTKLGVKSTVNGITYTTYENGILITGTATKDFFIVLHNDIIHPLTRGDYYLTTSGINSSVSLNFYYIGKFVDNMQNIKVTLGKDVEYSLCLQIPKGATLNTTVQVSLTKSKITSYEPYYEEQTATLPYILNAIPVSGGGNVIIDGQQYIADYVDVERGKVVRMCGREALNTKNGEINEEYRLAIRLDTPACKDGSKECIFSTFKWSNWTTCVSGTSLYIKNIKKPNNELYTAQELKELSIDFDVVYQLSEQQETDLTPEQTQALKELVTYYPVTNITVGSEQLDGYTVFNYPISLADGWNYVKQQINDNRDYIYDMDAKTQDIDTQSAEAYVNSEYAVALTELEVM